jgi:hypothetical protein
MATNALLLQCDSLDWTAEQTTANKNFKTRTWATYTYYDEMKITEVTFFYVVTMTGLFLLTVKGNI